MVRRRKTGDESRLAPHIFRPFSAFPSQGAKATEFRQDQTECQWDPSPWTECASRIPGGRFGQPIKHPDRPSPDTHSQEGATSSNNTNSSNNYNPPYSIQPPHQAPLEPTNYSGAQQAGAEWDYGTHQSGDARGDSQSTLPSIQSLNRVNEAWHEDNASRNQSEAPAFRAWPPDSTYDNVEAENRPQEPIDQSIQQQQAQSDHRNGSSQWQEMPLVSNSEGFTGQGKYSSSASQQSREQSTSPMTNTATQMDTSMYASASYVQNQFYPPSTHQQPEVFQSGSSIPLPRHTYTRTLVGPLCANASKLSDEHRKSGIFFLFQDLSIRTEGTIEFSAEYRPRDSCLLTCSIQGPFASGSG